MESLATYGTTQNQNTIQHYYAGDSLASSKSKCKGVKMACKSKSGGKGKK